MSDNICIEAYKPLIDEIGILEMRIEGLAIEKRFLEKKMKRGPSDINSIDYSGMPRGSQEQKDLKRYIEEIQRLENLIYLDEEILRIKKETLRKIESRINNFKGIEHKVLIRVLKGKNLKEISDELGYSYDWIKKVNAKIQKAL